MSGYNGEIEVLEGEDVVVTCEATLSGHTEMIDAGDERLPGLRSWWGVLHGSERALRGLNGALVTLRTPDGRTGEATITHSDGTVQGTGPPPFDM